MSHRFVVCRIPTLGVQILVAYYKLLYGVLYLLLMMQLTILHLIKDSIVTTASCIILRVSTCRYCMCYAGKLIFYVGAYEMD